MALKLPQAMPSTCQSPNDLHPKHFEPNRSPAAAEAKAKPGPAQKMRRRPHLEASQYGLAGWQSQAPPRLPCLSHSGPPNGVALWRKAGCLPPAGTTLKCGNCTDMKIFASLEPHTNGLFLTTLVQGAEPFAPWHGRRLVSLTFT